MGAFEIKMHTRFRDMDAMGHVNNSVYFTYFEEGRKYLYFDLFGTLDPAAFTFIVAHVGCDYLKSIRLDNEVTLRIWVENIGRKSFSLAYRLIDGSNNEIVYAKGESVQVCYDYGENVSVDVSEELREKLSKYSISG
ncbi:MAG: acyl-CoA thioesterase [Syntrophobacteraceae bacterium]